MALFALVVDLVCGETWEHAKECVPKWLAQEEPEGERLIRIPGRARDTHSGCVRLCLCVWHSLVRLARRTTTDVAGHHSDELATIIIIGQCPIIMRDEWGVPPASRSDDSMKRKDRGQEEEDDNYDEREFRRARGIRYYFY